MPVCRLTEKELREQIHQVMIPNLNQVNPKTSRVVDLSKYSRMNDLYLFEKQINMGYEIKKYPQHKEPPNPNLPIPGDIDRTSFGEKVLRQS